MRYAIKMDRPTKAASLSEAIEQVKTMFNNCKVVGDPPSAEWQTASIHFEDANGERFDVQIEETRQFG